LLIIVRRRQNAHSPSALKAANLHPTLHFLDTPMKIATWNVNSLKVRLPQVLDWLSAQGPEVLCLQETKTEDKNFPRAEIEAAGYQVLFSGQKTYNGVAILSKEPAVLVASGIPGFEDEQKRLLAADVAGLRVVCGYFPNGQSLESDKYPYKLSWLAALQGWLETALAEQPRLVLLGDFNIAPEDRDADPAAGDCATLVSAEVRAAFRGLLELGLVDSFRQFEQPEKTWSWWDYRMMAFRRNMGLRIDHILLSRELAPLCRSCKVDKAPRKLERPSDHAPVIAELDVPS
jgi:exodeoxyribonuclease-3